MVTNVGGGGGQNIFTLNTLHMDQSFPEMSLEVPKGHYLGFQVGSDSAQIGLIVRSITIHYYDSHCARAVCYVV